VVLNELSPEERARIDELSLRFRSWAEAVFETEKAHDQLMKKELQERGG